MKLSKIALIVLAVVLFLVSIPYIFFFWYIPTFYGPNTTLLSAPGSAIAYDSHVALILGDRECDKSYLIERSVDREHWTIVDTVRYTTYESQHDPNLKNCENSYVDTTAPLGAGKLYYRYHVISEHGVIQQSSEIGEVIFEDYKSLTEPQERTTPSKPIGGKMDCSPYISVISNKLGIPVSDIHTDCEAEMTKIGDEEYVVIFTYYGEEQDCPSGCFHSSRHLAVRLSDNKVFDLPSTKGSVNYYEFPLPTFQNQLLPVWSQPTWAQMKCDNDLQMEQGLSRQLVERDEQIGYEVRLNVPLVCTWEETKSQVFSRDYESSTVLVDDVVTEWSGTVFQTVNASVPDVQLRELSRQSRTYTVP